MDLWETLLQNRGVPHRGKNSAYTRGTPGEPAVTGLACALRPPRHHSALNFRAASRDGLPPNPLLLHFPQDAVFVRKQFLFQYRLLDGGTLSSSVILWSDPQLKPSPYGGWYLESLGDGLAEMKS